MAKDEKIKKSKSVKETKKMNNNFLKESKAELKKVNWPKPRRLVNDTATVIGIVLIVAVIVFILDFAFLKLNEDVILKAQENIKNNNNTVVTPIDSINESTESTEQESTVTVEPEGQENGEQATENTENVGTENNNAE